MIDYSRIVDDLRSAICSANPEWVDFLRSAAADYAVACEEANERLRRCGEYLRKGLRSEAIQLAEIEPGLLDCVAVLDFPERGQCCGVLTHYGIRTPTPLLLDVAADLNEAYAIERPMATLLQRHRLLALARSPLRLRLGVLRQLVTVDANNQVWQEDVVEFERERLKEFQQEVAEALQRGDLTMLTALEKELHSEGWQELPPPSLVQWTSGQRLNLFTKQSREELGRLGQQLNDAFSAFDVATGRNLRDRWRQVTAQIALAEGDQLHELARPAFEWLDQETHRERAQANFEKAESNLEHLLNRNAPLPELEHAYHAITRQGTEPNDYLVTRYRKRVSSLQEQAIRRRKKQIVLIALASVVAVGVIGAAVYIPVRMHAVTSHVERLHDLIESGRLDDASEYLTKLSNSSPGIAQNAQIQDLGMRLKGLKKAETERATAFNDLAKNIAVSLTAMRHEAGMLEQLRKMAKTPSEKSRLAELEAHFAKVGSETQAKRDEEFLKQSSVYVERVEELEKLPIANSEELRRRVSRLRLEIDGLETNSDSVTSRAKASLKSLRTRLTAMDDQITRWQEEEASEKRLTRAIGDQDRFVTALQTHMHAFPEASRTSDFRRVIEEAKLWPSIDDWNSLAIAWRQKSLTDLTPDDAVEQVRLTTKFAEEHQKFPGFDVLQSRLPYLNAIVQRNDKGQRLELKLVRLFTDPLVADLWMVVHKDGRRFYGRAEPKIEPDKINGFKYVIQFDFTEKNIGLRTDNVVAKSLAPQSTSAKELNRMLSELTDKTWDRSFFQMLKTIHESAEMDPILKVNLLQQVLEIGRQGSLVFEKTFSDYATILKSSKADPFANWLDPADEEAKEQRRLAKEVLAKLPDFKNASNRARMESEKIHRPVGRIYRWIGWLRRSAQGEWQSISETTSQDSGELFVLAVGPGGVIGIEKIGRVKAGVFEITSQQKDALVEGRPVYFSQVDN